MRQAFINHIGNYFQFRGPQRWTGQGFPSFFYFALLSNVAQMNFNCKCHRPSTLLKWRLICREWWRSYETFRRKAPSNIKLTRYPRKHPAAIFVRQSRTVFWYRRRMAEQNTNRIKQKLKTTKTNTHTHKKQQQSNRINFVFRRPRWNEGSMIHWKWLMVRIALKPSYCLVH